MAVEQVTTEPYNMEAGNVTAVKLTILYVGDNPAPPKEEIVEINPVPFKVLGEVAGALAEHIKAKTEFEELKEHYDSLKETCRRTHKEAEAILKHPSFAETAEKHRQEMEQSIKDEEERKRQAEFKLKEAPEKLIVLPEEKSIHEETTQQQPQEPETTRQQAGRIYDTVLAELKGKSIEDKEVMLAVMKEGIHSDDVMQVTTEIIGLLKERGAIETPLKKITRVFSGKSKKKKKEEK